MLGDWHRVFEGLHLNEREGIRSCDVPGLHEVRPLDQRLQLSDFQPPHLFALFARELLLLDQLGLLFFGVFFCVLRLLRLFLGLWLLLFLHFADLGKLSLLHFCEVLEDVLKLLVVYARQLILVFLNVFSVIYAFLWLLGGTIRRRLSSLLLVQLGLLFLKLFLLFLLLVLQLLVQLLFEHLFRFDLWLLACLGFHSHSR